MGRGDMEHSRSRRGELKEEMSWGKNTWHEVSGENEKKGKGCHEDEWTGDGERGGHMAAGRRMMD
jgi:hypothetical protein